MTQIRNITFQDPEAPPATQAVLPENDRLKLRFVTVSPHEEYQLRSGEVRPISNELASAILSRKGRAEITLKGIVVDRKDMGGRNTYWHEDSRICNDLSARDRKIFYVVNPLRSDVVHLLTDTGIYIESLPIKFRPEVLNTEQQAAEVAKHHRQIGRVARHMQTLHGEATKQALEDLAENSREMQRVVQVLPAPETVPRHEAPTTTGPARQVQLAEENHRAGTTTYDRSTPRKDTTSETAAQILARRAGIEVECPY